MFELEGQLKSFKILMEKDINLATQVNEVYELVKETINSISGCFNNYTMHDMGHGIRVAKYMEQLAFGMDKKQEERINEFSPFELALMILCSILHDIGMFIRPQNKEEIKQNKIRHSDTLTYEGVLDVKGNEEETIKEIIRITHARRIADFIEYQFDGDKSISKILRLNNVYAYYKDVVLICQAHGENYEFLKKNLRDECTKGSYNYNPQYLAALLRIADYLDLDRQRTPILWFSMMGINGFSREEWKSHFIISNETKLKEYFDDKLQIYFEGESHNAKIHRKYLKYIDNLRKELEDADNLLNHKNSKNKYRLNLTTKIEDNVSTKGFQYSDLRLTLDYTSITELLMGRNIYGDSKLGMRELIQNSIDACKLMKELRDEFSTPWEPQIYIIYSQMNNYIKIKDTGIGMTLSVIKNHFLNVGKSYYKSDEYKFKKNKYQPIGQYGIGFLACFLLSDNITVTTKHYESNDVYQIELEKCSEYVVTQKIDNHAFYGTEIKMDYNQFINIFKTIGELKLFLSKSFLTDIPIYLINDDLNERTNIVNETIEHMNLIYQEEKTTKKIFEIECNKYSDSLKGKLYLDIGVKNKQVNINIKSLENTNIYIFNKNKNLFEIHKNIEQGMYCFLKYAQLADDQYLKIRNSKSYFDRRATEILTLAKKQGKEMYLFIKAEDYYDLQKYLDKYLFDFEQQVDMKEFKCIFENSNLPYYEELLDENNVIDCFYSKNKYIELQNCIISINDKFRNYYIHKEHDDEESYLYCKDILVSDFRALVVELPLKCKIFCYINYINNDVKLNVSRMDVIEGRYTLQKEVEKVIVNYLIEIIKNAEKKEMLIEMLENIDEIE